MGNGTSYFGITYGSALAIEGAIVVLLVATKIIPDANDPTALAVVGLINVILGIVYHVSNVQAKRRAAAGLG